MASKAIYLNFARQTEEAFNFYKSIFVGEITWGGNARFSDILAQEGMPQLFDENKNLVMHVELPVLGGTLLMGTDAPESMGYKVNMCNNMHISIESDSRTEADKLFVDKVTQALQDMF
jgi:PhnB protein